jgi:hypothetical protein
MAMAAAVLTMAAGTASAAVRRMSLGDKTLPDTRARQVTSVSKTNTSLRAALSMLGKIRLWDEDFAPRLPVIRWVGGDQ